MKAVTVKINGIEKTYSHKELENMAKEQGRTIQVLIDEITYYDKSGNERIRISREDPQVWLQKDNVELKWKGVK